MRPGIPGANEALPGLPQRDLLACSAACNRHPREPGKALGKLGRLLVNRSVHIANADTDRLLPLERTPIPVLPVPREGCGLVGSRSEALCDTLPGHDDLQIDPLETRRHTRPTQGNL